MVRRKQQIPSACTSRDHKPRQKRARNQEGDGEGDRISNLPESLLSNILSRLPTKDAVRTSVLSKKWEYKWTCIYNLEFNDRQFYAYRLHRKDHFSYFVDRVLMHGVGSLQSFILRCSSSYDLSRIHAWILAALRRNVQILEVFIWSESLELPHCIYDSNSLKELRLLSQVTISVPNETLFSKLKKIYFNQVIIGNQDSSTNGQLLLMFPFLESLYMYCKWRNVKAVKLDAPLLTSFHMTFASHQNGDRMEGFVFEICGPNLADFKLNGSLSECYVLRLPKPSPLETATIQMFFPSNRSSIEWSPSGSPIARILRQMNALKYLELSAEVLIALNHVAQISSLPLFVNLIHLKMYTAYYVLTDGAAVIQLIQRAPVLQMLTMDMSATLWKDLLYHGSQGDGTPPCFSSHLKVVKFLYLNKYCLKTEEDLGLMKFILKNARALEQLQVIGPIGTNPTPSLEIRELLLSFPRGSSVAQIMFS